MILIGGEEKNMQIGIVDDNELWCEKAQFILQKYAESIGEEMEIIAFFSKDGLMKYEGNGIDVLFLDIVLEKEK